MSAPAVSVILRVARPDPLLARALRSVLAQSFRDLEVLVLDDAPADETAGVVKSFDDHRVRYLRHPSGRGAGIARNEGVRLARGEYVAFLGSGDEWLLDKLEHQVSRLRSLPQDVAVTQAAIMRCDKGGVRHLFNHLAPGTDRATFLDCGMNTAVQGWLARRSALLAIGGFDETLQAWEEWELLIRICQSHRADLDGRLVGVVYDIPDVPIARQQACLESVLDKHKTAMAPDRTAMAHNLYRLGRLYLLEGDAGRGRALLRQSVLHHPRSLAAWTLLLAAMFGSSLARSTATRLEGHTRG